MSIVKRKTLKSNPENKSRGRGVFVKDIIKLIIKSPFYDELYNVFQIDEIKEEFIDINGASEIVEGLISADEQFLKTDIETKLSDVSLQKITDDNQIKIEILNIKNETLIKRLKKDAIVGESIYSVKSDYLNELYRAEKYLDFCKKENFDDIIDENIRLLNAKNRANDREKSFRLLVDGKNEIYIRGITSVESYKDYNLRISLFVALIELHKLIKHKSYNFYIDSYSYTESDLRVTFKSDVTKKISDNIKLGFALELSNDEIRRESVRFNGVFTVFMGDTEIYVHPETKTSITYFTHSSNVETFKEKLSNLKNDIESYIENTTEDARKIKILNKPDSFREYLQLKIQNSRNSEFSKDYKGKVQKILQSRVSTVFELAEILKKVDLLIADDDIASLDYWRYKLYQTLFESLKK